MATIRDFNMPDELFYSTKHMWVRAEGDTAVVGVTDFTQKAAGEVTYIELPSAGDEVEAGDLVGAMETGKWMGKLYAPISGEITEVNAALEDEPSLINQDPYGKAWIFKLRMKDAAEVKSLMQGEALVPWLEAEIKKNLG